MESTSQLRERIRLLEEENSRLRLELDQTISQRTKETMEYKNTKRPQNCNINHLTSRCHEPTLSSPFPTIPSPAYEGVLRPEEIERYSRQLLVHGGFGVEGQQKLRKSSVLIVGAGGIGSTGTKNHNCWTGKFKRCFSNTYSGALLV